MQVTFTLDVKCDFQDRAKYAEVWTMLFENAASMYYRVLLLQQADAAATDNKFVEPQVNVHSDDTWNSTSIVKRLSELIKQANEQGIDFVVTDKVLQQLGVEIPQ